MFAALQLGTIAVYVRCQLTLSRLENLLMTACDALRVNMDTNEYKELRQQKLGLMQDLLTGKFSVQ